MDQVLRNVVIHGEHVRKQSSTQWVPIRAGVSPNCWDEGTIPLLSGTRADFQVRGVLCEYSDLEVQLSGFSYGQVFVSFETANLECFYQSKLFKKEKI